MARHSCDANDDDDGGGGGDGDGGCYDDNFIIIIHVWHTVTNKLFELRRLPRVVQFHLGPQERTSR